MQKQNPLSVRLLGVGILIIIMLIPFHAFFTAWFASNFGYFDLIRLWKEIILIGLIITSAVLIYKDRTTLSDLIKDKLVLFCLGYLGLVILMTVYGIVLDKVSLEAAAYGLIINTRFILFMLVTYIFAKQTLINRWPKYILLPAILVLAFGLLQSFLPADFLRHFGYGPETQIAYQAIDNKPEFARIQSTLRGPNPLGAYLIIILTMVFAQTIRHKKMRKPYLALSFLTLFVLYGTHSRSAWLGAIFALWLFVFIKSNNVLKRKILYMVTALILVVSGTLILVFRDNDSFQNVVFHTNELSSSLESSNERRSNAIKDGFVDLYKQPLGGGVGSAGPASFRNDGKPTRIAENYFIQITQEAGILGLIAFLIILIIIAGRLLAVNSPISLMLVAALGGLIVVNMLSHAWADDTLAYIFFGMVGLALGQKISTKSENLRYTKRKHVNQTP